MSEKVWEAVMLSSVVGQQTVRLTKEELEKIDPDRIITLRYVGAGQQVGNTFK